MVGEIISHHPAHRYGAEALYPPVITIEVGYEDRNGDTTIFVHQILQIAVKLLAAGLVPLATRFDQDAVMRTLAPACVEFVETR